MQKTGTMSRAEVLEMRRPLVYVARGSDGSALYVGMSLDGIRRLLDRLHHAIEHSGYETTDWQSCASPAEAKALESAMIAELQPPLNRLLSKATSGERGIYRHGKRWRAYARVNGVLRAKVMDTVDEARQWRREQRLAA